MDTSCTLPTAEQPLRLAEFDDLFRTALRSQERVSPAHLRWLLAPVAEAVTRSLTTRESRCCSFFTFTVRPAGADLWVDVELPAEYSGVLDALEMRAQQGLSA